MGEPITETLNKSFVNRSERSGVNRDTGISTSTTDTEIVSWVESRIGVKNPNWRSSVQNLDEAGTNYTRTGAVKYSAGSFSISEDAPPTYDKTGTLISKGYSSRYTWRGIVLPGLPSSPSSVYNEALGRFGSNIQEALSPFKGMTFLGELKETLHMIRRPALTLRDGFSAYLNRAHREIEVYGKSKAVRKRIGNWYLEYTYGWSPLLGDIESATNAYHEFVNSKQTQFVTASSQGDLPASNTTAIAGKPPHMYYIVNTKTTGNSKVVFKGVVVRELSGEPVSSVRRVLDLSGFRLGEFIPTLWELLPYSFVVDYFTNIGDILNTIHALGADIAWKSCSTKSSTLLERNFKVDSKRFAPYAAQGLSLSGTSSPIVVSRTNYTRVVPALSVPSLSLRLPGVGWTWVNLLALLNQRV